MNDWMRNNGHLLLVMLLVMILLQWQLADSPQVQLAYSEFSRLLEAGKVSDLQVGSNSISGQLVDPVNGQNQFITYRVDPEIASLLQQHGVHFSGSEDSNGLQQFFGWFLPLLLIFAFWSFMLRRMGNIGGGGLMGVGKSHARLYVEHDTGVSFEDLAGVDEARAELAEVVAFLRDPAQYGRLGAHIPKGILLIGPPGTGKTLAARAVAGEAGVAFFSISGSEFVEMFVGVGAARVRDLFEQARKAAPCIIFIDELDALGKMRGIGNFGGNDEKEQTLNQLLTELDGFDPREGVVLLAATNRPEILDPALLRAGRFDRQILVDRPDRRGRAAILRVHLKQVAGAQDLDVEAIAAMTTGFTGADLANLVNEATLLATRRQAQVVSLADFTEALERVIAGSERRGRLLQPHERKVVAFHEMGHALVASALPGMDPVHKVSIIPRSAGALGYTLQRPTEDRFLIGRQELLDRMAVLMAGRAAEQLVFAEVSTGAADDLARATDIARQLVTRFGMHPDTGQVVLEQRGPGFLGGSEPGSPAALLAPQRDYSEQTAREVDLAVRSLVDEAFQRATALLERRRSELAAGAGLLLERETLTPEDFPPLRPQAGALTGE